MDIRRTSIRFNIDKPLYQKAWEYLQTMDKDKFKSYSHVVAVALVEYFERYYMSKDDPYFETREREERFIKQIVEEVGRNIRLSMPEMIIGNALQDSSQSVRTPEGIEEDADIDWDFAGTG